MKCWGVGNSRQGKTEWRKALAWGDPLVGIHAYEKNCRGGMIGHQAVGVNLALKLLLKID